jgi:methoxymalonate biosynthesis acyl carrier protein
VTISPADRTESTQVESELHAFLTTRLKTSIQPDLDLFASGTVSSMFAMELVVHLEKTFSITIAGSDLMMDNFRTINSMAALVLRLQGTPGA